MTGLRWPAPASSKKIDFALPKSKKSRCQHHLKSPAYLNQVPPTPAKTLSRAREIALANGVRHAYTGNVVDPSGGSTYCHSCGELVIGRDWYRLTAWGLDRNGYCAGCGTRLAGVFEERPGTWGSRRAPVRLGQS